MTVFICLFIFKLRYSESTYVGYLGFSDWEKMLNVAFLGIIVMVMGECQHGGVGMLRG